MNRSNVVLIICLACFLEVTAQKLKPDVQAFLPGVVSTEANEFNACFSKDSKSFYFSRTTQQRTIIYATHELNGTWSRPQPLPFCMDGFSYADPAFSPDGELYFISNRPTSEEDTTKDFDIWKTSWHQREWGEPVNVSILNSSQDEYYISFSSNRDAYFSSSRPGGYGEEDIYVAKFNKNGYQPPMNMGSAVNSIYSEYDPWISANGGALIFTSNGRKDSFGKADLYWVEKNNGWGDVHHFGITINTPTRDFCPYVTGSGQFFYSSEGQVKTILQTNFLKELNHLAR